MRTGWPASAARKAAPMAMLWMLPPETRRRARRSTLSPSTGVREGKMRRQISARCARFGKRELDDKAKAAQKCLVERGLAVGGQDGEAAIGLHALQQVADLDVRVAVVAVFDLGALAEERVGFVEEQDGGALFGGVEDAAQILLGLADVLADDLAEVDAEEIEAQLVREHLRGGGLARAAGAREEDTDAEAARAAVGEAPAFVDAGALANMQRRCASSARALFRAARGRPRWRPARCAARGLQGADVLRCGRRPRGRTRWSPLVGLHWNAVRPNEWRQARG